MKILVQWTRAEPTDWEEIDSAQWRSLERRPEPRGVETLDQERGWVYRLDCQGVQLHGDHYAVEPLPGRGCRITTWNDDPEDYPEGKRFALVWDFLPLTPDKRFGGRYNTRQSRIIYADTIPFTESDPSGAPNLRAKFLAFGAEPDSVRQWDEFVKPSGAITRHGIWVPDHLNERHNEARRKTSWREWTDGVPSQQVRNGRVK